MRKSLILLCIAILVIALIPAAALRKMCSGEDGCDQLFFAQDVFDRNCTESINTGLIVSVLFPLLVSIPSLTASRAPPVRISL